MERVETTRVQGNGRKSWESTAGPLPASSYEFPLFCATEFPRIIKLIVLLISAPELRANLLLGICAPLWSFVSSRRAPFTHCLLSITPSPERPCGSRGRTQLHCPPKVGRLCSQTTQESSQRGATINGGLNLKGKVRLPCWVVSLFVYLYHERKIQRRKVSL